MQWQALVWKRLSVSRLKGRAAIIPILAALAGLAAAWSAHQHIQEHVQRLEADARVPSVTRVVAAFDLPAGTRIGAEHLAAREFPAALVPSDSVDVSRHTQLTGMVLRSALKAGDLMLPVHGSAADHVAFSSHLEEGRRAISLPVDAINSVSGLLEPGDLIDLYVSFEYQRRRITAPLLQSVLVLATGSQTFGDLDQGAARSGFTTLTLDASPEDVVKLVAARQGGHITAVLRHPADSAPNRKAVRGDLASLIGVSNPPPVRPSVRAPVLYGNQQVRTVPGLIPGPAGPRQPSGIFDLPHDPVLTSSWFQSRARGPFTPASGLSADEEEVIERAAHEFGSGFAWAPGDRE